MGNTLHSSEVPEKEHLVDLAGDSQETSDICNDSKKSQETTTGGKVYYKALAFLAELLHIGCLVLSAVCVQLLERKIPDFELNFMRCLTGFIVFSGYFVMRRHSPLMPKSGILITVVYGTVATGLSLSNFISVTFIPLASFQSLKTTSHIVLSVILFALFAQEHIALKNIFSAIVCITGVLMILQPEFMFEGSHSRTVEQHGEFLNTIFT